MERRLWGEELIEWLWAEDIVEAKLEDPAADANGAVGKLAVWLGDTTVGSAESVDVTNHEAVDA